ncbi:hypothetical protein ACIHFE_20335 [Streptomyces sp. NPDC052396]|uniref:hypothetical protein n=1 Tax=Streptomyces sp. NPDC052396 TaxID=3365689 RepID=UPI0037D6976C
MKTMTRYAALATALVCCCLPLTACGTEHAGAGEQAAATPGPRTSATHETDQTDESDQTDGTDGTDGTDETYGTDETSDDHQENLPDTTDERPDPDGPPRDNTEDDDGAVPTAGPHRWFPMRREFRAYLGAHAPKADAAIASHVRSVYTRTPAGSARLVAVVRVDYGITQQDDADRTARVFARWRRSLYGDHGHVEVYGPAKTDAQQDW